MNGNLTGLRLEYGSGNAGNIADVHLFERLIFFLTDIVTRHVTLDLSVPVLNVAERSLAHYTLAHHSTGNGNGLVFQLFKIIFNIQAVGRDIKGGDKERIVPALLQFT